MDRQSTQALMFISASTVLPRSRSDEPFLLQEEVLLRRGNPSCGLIEHGPSVASSP
jgi:hypothetical protein